MVSTEQISNVIKKLDVRSSRNRRSFAIKRKSIRSEEIDLLTSMPVCSNALLAQIRENLPYLDASLLKHLATSESDNPEVMKAVKCTTNAIMYIPPEHFGINALNKQIKEYITNLSQIGTASANGIAFSAMLKEQSDMYVIKTGKTEQAGQELIHELTVGTYGTNKMRNICPNFAYVYGGFRCSPPIGDQKKSICDFNNNKVNYIIYESVLDSIPIKQYLTDTHSFLEILFPILYALKAAEKEIDFTHYDLHTDNVLLRQGNKSVGYETENGYEYVNSSVTPVIIDYGRSHIKHDDKDYGFVGALKYSTYFGKSWIMHDVYKFFMFMALSSYKNEELRNLCSILFQYFNKTENLGVALKKQHEEHRFSLPITAETSGFTIDDFAAYIRKNVNTGTLISDTPFFPQKVDTKTEKEVYDEVDATLLPVLYHERQQNLTLSQFLEQHNKYFIDGDENSRIELIERYNFRPALDYIYKTSGQIDDYIDRYNQVIIGNYSYSQLLNPEIMNKFIDMYQIIGNLRVLVDKHKEDLDLIHEYGRVVDSYVPEDEYRLIVILINRYNDIRAKLEEMLVTIPAINESDILKYHRSEFEGMWYINLFPRNNDVITKTLSLELS